MRTSTNQFNINDAVNALPTLEEYLTAELAKLTENPQPILEA